ncbi:MAG: polyhydroxyalkanoic acid system family protein [Deltaproteobacteria bacterium]|nr:polyhydroxyalkanoic acid system family protein [Deltaproteobacteria bacterium]
MSDIKVKRNHTMGQAEARRAAEEIAENLKDRLQVGYHWDGEHLRFKRTGAEGYLWVTEEAIEISIKLGLMFRPMKGVIEGKIVEFLDKKLG